MGEAALKLKQLFTWDDYLTWPDDERWEIIDGEAFSKSPSPNWRHQDICGALLVSMTPHFRKGPCKLFISPLDVKLSDEDIVQPDLLVVCDEKQKTERGHIEGPPKLAVEILSPSSTMHDRIRKMRLYAKFGVHEYWIVTPHQPSVEIFVLQNGEYVLRGLFLKEDTLSSPSFPGLTFPLAEIFTAPPDPDAAPPMIAREPTAKYAVAP